MDKIADRFENKFKNTVSIELIILNFFLGNIQTYVLICWVECYAGIVKKEFH